MSSTGNRVMTLPVKDYQEKRKKRFLVIHACDCDCLQYEGGKGVILIFLRRPVLMSPEPSGDGLYSWLRFCLHHYSFHHPVWPSLCAFHTIQIARKYQKKNCLSLPESHNSPITSDGYCANTLHTANEVTYGFVRL